MTACGDRTKTTKTGMKVKGLNVFIRRVFILLILLAAWVWTAYAGGMIGLSDTVQTKFNADSAISNIITQEGLSGAINLNPGWNFFSLPKEPPDISISSALSSVLSNVRVVWGYDNSTKEWLRYKPGIQSQTVFKTLEKIETGKGYWAYMNKAGTINTTGWTDPLSFYLPVYPGWNLVGYWGNDNISIIAATQSVSGNWSIIWGWNTGIWEAAVSSDVNWTTTAQPLNFLNRNKAYWISIKTGTGNVYWGPDITKPSVSSISFVDHAVNMPINTTITATFSEPIDQAYLNSSSFIVSANNGTPINGAIIYNASTKTATFNPSGNLSYSTAYTVTLTTAIKDPAGNTLDKEYTWTFTTMPEQSPVGIWKGTAYSNGWARYYSVASIILPTNEERASTGTSQDVGTASVTNGNSLRISSTSYAADGYIFYDGSVISTNVCQGTIVTKQSFSGTCTSPGDSGSISLNYSPIYERTSSLSKVSGMWEYYDAYNHVTYHLNINSSGQITGGDTYNICSMNGTASVISSSYNAYRVNITLANCGTGNNGTFNGLAYLDDTLSLNDTLMTLISKNDKAISVPFLKK